MRVVLQRVAFASVTDDIPRSVDGSGVPEISKFGRRPTNRVEVPRRTECDSGHGCYDVAFGSWPVGYRQGKPRPALDEVSDAPITGSRPGMTNPMSRFALAFPVHYIGTEIPELREINRIPILRPSCLPPEVGKTWFVR
jgi:hypothetical protein